MIVGVVGGRDFEEWPLLKAVLDKANEEHGIDVIVSGGANGADGYAYVYAKKTGINFICYPPLKDEILNLGFVYAAKQRNIRIVEHCDILYAFPTEKSKGTWHTIREAKKLNKPCRVMKSNGMEDTDQ